MKASGISVTVGAATMLAIQWALGQLWAVWPPSLGGHGGAIEIMAPPIPSVSFALSGLGGGWVAAALAPRRPKTHACAAAALPTLFALTWLSRQANFWYLAPAFWLRFALLWLGAWFGALGQSWHRSSR